jgi:hypothetical protein
MCIFRERVDPYKTTPKSQ